MKITGRILIISAVFLLFSGLMVAADNLLGMVPGLDRPSGGDRPAFTSNDNSEVNTQFRPPEREGGDEGRDQGPSFRGFRWVLSIGKNVVIMGVFVMLIVFPKSLVRKKKRKPVLHPQKK